MNINSNPKVILRDILIIFILAFSLGLIYTLIIYGDLNFLERAKHKSSHISNENSSQKIKEISTDQAFNLIQNHKPIIIDARNESQYQINRIENSINIPAKNFESYIDYIFSFPKDTLIIIYCEGVHCQLSHQLAEKMQNFGFTNLNIMYEGIEGWQQKNLPLIKNEN